jgi:hypothetical protein
MPISLTTPIALVQEFLPHTLEQADGPVLTAQGASAVLGRPTMTGPGPAQAAQRNYLQCPRTLLSRRRNRPCYEHLNEPGEVRWGRKTGI